MAKTVFRPSETKVENDKVMLPLVRNYAPEEEVEEIKKTMTGEIPDTPWFKAEHSKQYISKDFNYFMKQAEKALSV